MTQTTESINTTAEALGPHEELDARLAAARLGGSEKQRRKQEYFASRKRGGGGQGRQNRGRRR